VEQRTIEYELYTSQVVLDECSAGDQEAAARRMAYVNELPILEPDADVAALARAILDSGVIPEGAAQDAVHIALTAVYEIDFLLTWNCRHIANAHIIKDLENVVAMAGFRLPVICTPEELVGG
jgi:hypothetical protein